MAIECPVCGSDDLMGGPKLSDGRIPVQCLACDHEWVRGQVHRTYAPPPTKTIEQLHAAFPRPEDVLDSARERIRRLASEFLALQPTTDPAVAPYWRKYQVIFSAEGLPEAAPADLKSFANSSTGAHPGMMSVFNSAWNSMGDDMAAARVRGVVEYLLRGPAGTRLEDRFTDLVEERKGLGMPGLKESLLTKVLCIVEPGRFLPLLKYTTPSGGKKEIAEVVYGLRLPEREKVSWTIGRLMTWSNDLLVELVGDEFDDLQHASHFLWWAKDRGAGKVG